MTIDYPAEAAVITSVLAILVIMVKTSSRIAFEKIDYYSIIEGKMYQRMLS